MSDKLLELLENNQNILKELATKAPASTQTATLLNQSSGIFSVAGLDPTVINAYVGPYQSIASVIPLLSTQDGNPLFASFTGYTADSGTQPANACDDAPSADMKSCILTAQFGMTRFDTKTIEINTVIQNINRGVFNDLQLAGQVLHLNNLVPAGLNTNDIVSIVEMAAMVTAAAQTERKLVNELWQGVVTNTNEFPGLDVQIATGQVDAKTNQACPSLDSDVKDFTYNEVGGSDKDIAEYLEMLEYYLRNNAEAAGLDVQWVVAMRPQLWQRLSQVWPVKYNTLPTGLWATDNGQRLMIDGTDMTRQRDTMRTSKRITINGTDYQVVPDSGIFESNNINDGNLAAGEYASSIYMLPIRANGIPTLYREYLDYRQFGNQTFHLDRQDFWTDDGVYSWAIDADKWCYKYALKTEQRIVLRAPQLAGRIDNCKYTPLQHLREADPDSPYHYDGGLSIRNPETTYAVWK